MFNRLKLYTVHVKKGVAGALQNPIFVREGFNVYAFLFTIFWALYQRCYAFAVLIVLVNIALVSMVEAGIISDVVAALTQLAMQFLIGAHANDVLRDRLRKQGYIVQDITGGDSLLRAQQRYFDRMVAQPV